MKLISAAALQQKTRQFSVHHNASDKYTIELKESLKNVWAKNAKQANQSSPRQNMEMKKFNQDKIEMMSFQAKQKVHNIQVDEVPTSVPNQPQ